MDLYLNSIKTMKRPQTLFVGIRDDDMGFITPDGDDKAAEKRKQTTVVWAQQTTWGGKPQEARFLTIPNEMVYGFKLHDDPNEMVRSGSRGGEDAFKLYDPRGFWVEIRSRNLGFLLRYGNFERGMLTDKCIWLRNRTQNFLITEPLWMAIKM